MAAALVTGLLLLLVPFQADAASAPSPPPKSSALPEKLPKAKNSEFNLQPNTVHVLRLLEHYFPYYKKDGVIGGYRQDAIADHPSGQALDIMMANGGRDALSVNEGHKVAAFLMANSEQLGVTYMVWRQSIWYPGQDWRVMEDRGHWTHNHMDHIHLLVNGSHQASDELVAPKDLKVRLGEMPDGEALRLEHELRIAITARIRDAEAKVSVDEKTNKRLTNTNSRRALDLQAAQARVTQAVRENYILGMDSGLLNSSVMLMAGPNIDPAVALGLERTLRSQDESLNAALDALAAAARELAANESALGEARTELSTAQAELAELDAPS